MKDTIIIKIQKDRQVWRFSYYPDSNRAMVNYSGQSTSERSDIESLEEFISWTESTIHDLIDRQGKDYIEEQVNKGVNNFIVGLDRKVSIGSDS